MRAGKKRRSERRFFPGYLFVEMHMNEDTWQLVNSIPRVKGFVGGTIQKPAPLPPHEVESILERIRQGSDKVTPKTVFEPGELVRIIDGPFNDFNGTVEEVSYEKHRLVVAVTIFGRLHRLSLIFLKSRKDRLSIHSSARVYSRDMVACR